jgi:hypothetical protein
VTSKTRQQFEHAVNSTGDLSRSRIKFDSVEFVQSHFLLFDLERAATRLGLGPL